jgi:sec-independent protein translocase protein TatC
VLRWLPSLIQWFAKQPPPGLPGPAPVHDGTARDEGQASKPFVEHLEDLRRTLIRMALVLFVGFNICLMFANRILFVLEAPLLRLVPNPDSCLQSLNVTDSFVLSMKLAFYGGLLLTMPLVLYFVADFVLPALRPGERRAIIPAFVIGALLFVTGVALCYYLMIPQTLKAFLKYSEWLGIKPQWTVSSYISFVTQFMLAVGATFEVPLVILILVRLGVVQARTVARNRKIMIAAAVVLAAILAPPDPLSMVVMALPLIVMFEITVWLAWLVEKRAGRAKSASAGGDAG